MGSKAQQHREDLCCLSGKFHQIPPPDLAMGWTHPLPAFSCKFSATETFILAHSTASTVWCPLATLSVQVARWWI